MVSLLHSRNTCSTLLLALELDKNTTYCGDMKRLWDKGDPSNDLMRELTVGTDPVIDRELVYFDCVGSAAHARMLFRCGYLSEADLKNLIPVLREIAELGKEGRFDIPAELEDCHTAIEGVLAEKCGEAGKRIHTARSRNDQVLLAVRLYLRDAIVNGLRYLSEIGDRLKIRFEEIGAIPMPGYTHLQPAMPSSVGMWLHAWYEGILELSREGLHLLEVVNVNPLGSGAGFGSSLKIDRGYVASLLGLSRIQRNPIDVNNSRGRYEERFLRWSVDIAALFEKFAWDVLLFSTKEFGFFSLPVSLTTGSSIMPQKRNLDIVELLRGRASRVRGALHELQGVTMKLPSSYHRDFQYTKEPLIRATHEMDRVYGMMSLIVENLLVDEARLASMMHTDLFATYDANREVALGMPFRDAYKLTAQRVKNGTLDVASLKSDFDSIAKEISVSMNLAVDEFTTVKRETKSWQEKLERVERGIFAP